MGAEIDHALPPGLCLPSLLVWDYPPPFLQIDVSPAHMGQVTDAHAGIGRNLDKG